jgi:hypothetical protein
MPTFADSLPTAFDDAEVDPLDARWSQGPYGPGDELGSYREVTPRKHAAAVALLGDASSIRPVSLGETLFVGYPGWGTREYAQRLWLAGAQPAGFGGESAFSRPRGRNHAVSLEERVQTSYNIGTKVNGLAHVAVGSQVYGGRQLDDIVGDEGVLALDTTSWGAPLFTRGLLYDVLGFIRDQGRGSDLESSADGQPTLRANYRVTMEDLAGCERRQSLPAVEAGDALLVRTGWRCLLAGEPDRYLTHSPGVWLRETRALAALRPAVVGTDSWCWGTIDPALTRGQLASCHQELIVGSGIRIAESLDLDRLAATGQSAFVVSHNPLAVRGAVSSSSPMVALVPVPR